MKNFPFKKAIVTGGAGFIGSHICEKLLDIGTEVISIDDFSAGKKENHAHLNQYPKFTSVDCDITDYKKLKSYFKGIDVVFHNAASKKTVCLKDPRRDLEVNAKGTFNLLELSRDFNIKKFVHASTGSVYGEPVCTPQNENHPLDPASYYGVSKLAGERYAYMFYKVFGLNVTILRYFHVYGTRQESNEFGGVVAIFIRNMLKGEQPVIFGDSTQQRTFTYIDDVVKANLLVAKENTTKGEVYNCASGIKVTVQELCDKILAYFDKKDLCPLYKDWVIGDIKVFDIDNTKIKSLGMTFETDFFEMLKETVDYYKNNF